MTCSARLSPRSPSSPTVGVVEFAVGTGRVAIPLIAAGVPVSGIELSHAMIRRLREKAGEATLPVSRET